MDKLWAGRFDKPTSALLDDFQSSIPFDQRLIRCDIRGSVAHATMLGERGIISRTDSDAIVKGLAAILVDYDAGVLEIDMSAEDVHMFVETELTRRIGEAASACTRVAAATTRWRWTRACTRGRPASRWTEGCASCWKRS
jgi:argininosuccinate lyase